MVGSVLQCCRMGSLSWRGIEMNDAPERETSRLLSCRAHVGLGCCLLDSGRRGRDSFTF